MDAEEDTSIVINGQIFRFRLVVIFIRHRSRVLSMSSPFTRELQISHQTPDAAEFLYEMTSGQLEILFDILPISVNNYWPIAGWQTAGSSRTANPIKPT